MVAAAVAPTVELVPLPTRPVVLYDGVCGLCAKAVRFILSHERDHDILFAPLQGPTAAAFRAKFPHIPDTLSTVVFIEGDHAYLRSKAFLYLAGHFRAPWSWLNAFRWFPAVLGDLGYRVVAAIRYRLFGKVDSCELPSPANRTRFLE